MYSRMNCALYIRTSTAEQNAELQTREMEQFIQARGWTVAASYPDVESGAKARRPGLDRMMEDARRGKFRAIVVWKLDRFARSPADLYDRLREMESLGIRFLCSSQPIDTDQQSPAGRLLMAVLAAFADLERSMIRERADAGTRRYREDLEAGRIGTTVHTKSKKDLAPGRPRCIFDREQARLLADGGMSIRKIAEQLTVSPATILRELRKKESEPPIRPRSGP